MSKRAGTVVVLEDLVEAVGVDAARYALTRSSTDSMIDIDLDLLVRRGNENPVFYVQYAHARTLQRAPPGGRGRAAHRGRLRPLAADARDRGGAARDPRRLPAGGRAGGRAARAAPGRPLPRGPRRPVAQVVRRVPRASPGRRGDHRPAPDPALAERRHAAWCWPTAWACSASRRRSGCSARARGRRPPRRGQQRPVLAAAAAGRQRAGPAAVGRQRRARRRRGAAGGRRGRPRPGPAVRHPRLRPRRGRLPWSGRGRSGWPSTRPSPTSCGGADVYYAGKAFLCTAVARWVREEGLRLDVCSGGELAVAIRAGLPGGRIALHGNNKSTAEIEAALTHGVGRIVVDSFDGDRARRRGGDAGSTSWHP